MVVRNGPCELVCPMDGSKTNGVACGSIEKLLCNFKHAMNPMCTSHLFRYRAARGKSKCVENELRILVLSQWRHIYLRFADGAAEPVAGGQPVNIVQNISGDLHDATAERSRTTSPMTAGDRAGSLNDDEQRAGGAARNTLALLASPCGVG
eukprot:5341262-Prymnesium_polylepis.3